MLYVHGLPAEARDAHAIVQEVASAHEAICVHARPPGSWPAASRQPRPLRRERAREGQRPVAVATPPWGARSRARRELSIVASANRCSRTATRATSSIRLPQGSSTKNRAPPGISAGSAQPTSMPCSSSLAARRSSAVRDETRSAGCAFAAGTKRSATPTWSCGSPTLNQTPPRVASSGGFSSSSSPRWTP